MNAQDVEIMLEGLRLGGMANAFRDLQNNRIYDDLTKVEFIARLCLAQKETVHERLLKRLKAAAKFKFDAHPEDIIWDASRGIDKQKLRSLLSADWVGRMENVLLTGCSGTGKTWLVCAIGHALVRQGITVRYVRTNLLLENMRTAHLDGTISKFRKALTKPALLILDDFGISPIPEASKDDLFELLEARTDVGSTMITGQLAPSEWHDYLETGHLADAIMDRVMQRSHTIALKGDSLRTRLL